MKSREKSYLKLAVALFLAILAFLGLFFGLKAIEGKLFGGEEEGLVQDNFGRITHGGKTYKLKSQVETMLFIGLDTYLEDGSGRDGAMSDFLALAVFDHKAKSFRVVQINRDTMTDVPVLGTFGDYAGEAYQQIAWAHSYGEGKDDSCRNTADAVSALLYDVTINNYASVTLDAVGVVNDLVGGVEVEIEDDFSAVDDSLVMGERVLLKGKQAVTFVRSRAGVGDQSNLSRMGRQRAYMNALEKKYEEAFAKDNSIALTCAESVQDYIVTDCTVSELADLAKLLSTYEFEGIVTPEGESKVGKKYMEHRVDEDALKELVIELFYKEAE